MPILKWWSRINPDRLWFHQILNWIQACTESMLGADILCNRRLFSSTKCSCPPYVQVFTCPERKICRISSVDQGTQMFFTYGSGVVKPSHDILWYKNQYSFLSSDAWGSFPWGWKLGQMSEDCSIAQLWDMSQERHAKHYPVCWCGHTCVLFRFSGLPMSHRKQTSLAGGFSWVL